MAEPVYVGRESIASALDVKASAYMNREIDRACASGSRATEGLCNRRFYPLTATKYWDWPNTQSAPPWRVWLDDNELFSASAVVSNGVSIPSDSYNLEPNEYGPPYDRLELIRSGNYAFAGANTPQRAIAITGVWAGAPVDEEQPALLAASMSTASTTSLTLDSPAGDVGSLIRVGSERMFITDKLWSTSVQTVQNVSGMDASTNTTTLTVTDSTVYEADEIILIGTERMKVREIVGSTTLIVTRAWDGTTLTAHANAAPIYRQLTLLVQRGVLGTTAATHALNALVYRWTPPSLITEMAQAYAEDAFLQRNAGYARTVGSGDSERAASGHGIKDLEVRVRRAYARIGRQRSV